MRYVFRIGTRLKLYQTRIRAQHPTLFDAVRSTNRTAAGRRWGSRLVLRLRPTKPVAPFVLFGAGHPATSDPPPTGGGSVDYNDITLMSNPGALYRPFDELVTIKILGREFQVPKDNMLLRAMQYLSP